MDYWTCPRCEEEVADLPLLVSQHKQLCEQGETVGYLAEREHGS